jgi:hypothetical protein
MLYWAPVSGLLLEYLFWPRAVEAPPFLSGKFQMSVFFSAPASRLSLAAGDGEGGWGGAR